VQYIVGMAFLFGGLSTIQTMVYYHYVDVWDRPQDAQGGDLDYSAKVDDIKVRIDGDTVNVWELRSSATYVQISIAVEILIFSCRTTGWFFLDMPSWGLICGVMGANVIVSLCAVYGVIVSPHLTWEWVGNIWAYDIMWLVFIDACKICVNWAIGNSHSDILDYADMPAHMLPGGGGGVELQHSLGSRPSGSMGSIGNARPSAQSQSRFRKSNAQSRLSQRFSGVAADPSGAARASYAPRSSSLRPNLPQNVARDNGSAVGWGNDGGVGAYEDAVYARTNNPLQATTPLPRNSNGSANGSENGNTRV